MSPRTIIDAEYTDLGKTRAVAVRPKESLAGLGDIDWNTAISLVPQGLVHVVIHVPGLGNAIIDPFAPAENSLPQQLLNALGITYRVIVGPLPDDVQNAPLITGSSLLSLAMMAVGGYLLWRTLWQKVE